MLKINGISHITLVCKDLDKSAALFSDLFNAVEVYSSEKKNFSISKEKFFVIGDLWIALMEGPSLDRSYNHIAFHIDEKDLLSFETKIKALGLDIAPSRPRHPQEGRSIYFYDYDNHLFELHTGDLATRLNYYQNALTFKLAGHQEIEWVNQCYDQVEFVHSNLDHEMIAIAELGGEKAGLGRLVKMDEENLELGGMYVFEQFRNKGIATELVKFLLTQTKPSQNIYCIPFEHLAPFYQQFGFDHCLDKAEVPEKILTKLHWCQKKYASPTALLVLKKHPFSTRPARR
ncbi:MAG: FosX/FosE/FosI family fosfomycin resistance hydrolase [Parachlamydiales bacterium]|nr:FosX/FosE/FosI family fosfomycin resistance hydrolase [Candidatus Acheromyda pituitae]